MFKLMVFVLLEDASSIFGCVLSRVLLFVCLSVHVFDLVVSTCMHANTLYLDFTWNKFPCGISKINTLFWMIRV